MKHIAIILFAFHALSACSDVENVRTSKCPTLLPSWKKLTPGVVQHSLEWNKIVLSKGETTWNGFEVNEIELKKYLNYTRDRVPAFLVVFDPTGGSSCSAASKVRAIIYLT